MGRELRGRKERERGRDRESGGREEALEDAPPELLRVDVFLFVFLSVFSHIKPKTNLELRVSYVTVAKHSPRVPGRVRERLASRYSGSAMFVTRAASWR